MNTPGRSWAGLIAEHGTLKFQATNTEWLCHGASSSEYRHMLAYLAGEQRRSESGPLCPVMTEKSLRQEIVLSYAANLFTIELFEEMKAIHDSLTVEAVNTVRRLFAVRKK
jgi:hypothetical protein